jgi:RND family efflux transporter MFP subunit
MPTPIQDRLAQFLLWSLCACGMFALGCTKKSATSPVRKTPEVQVAQAVTKNVLDYEDFTGHTEACKSVVIRARVTGHLDRILFKDGQEVKEGDPLFEIDSRRLKAAADSADAAVVQAEARLKRLDDDLRRAQLVKATRAIADADYEKTLGDRAEADAAMRLARANREQARVDLSYCKIYAPLSGRISRTFMDPHNLVKADDTPLTNIVKLDPIYVYFDVDERTSQRIDRLIEQGVVQKTQSDDVRVLVGFASEEGFPHEGKVNFVDNQLNVDTGTMRYRCEIPNPSQLIKPGLFARIRLPIGVPHPAVVVPEIALSTDQGKKVVYVVDESVVENDDGSKTIVYHVVYHPVELGAQQGSERVIRDGVKAGERVIVSGLQRVRPGDRVDPKPVENGK